jgi:hypothetical protein
MIKKLLEWILGFFDKPVKQKRIEKDIKKHEERLEEIKDEKNTDDDLVDYLNK